MSNASLDVLQQPIPVDDEPDMTKEALFSQNESIKKAHSFISLIAFLLLFIIGIF